MRTLNENLNSFFNNNDKIMLVTGVWGVGKTHQVVNEWAKKNKNISNKCKIVTLFGCEKIDSLIWDILVGLGEYKFVKGAAETVKSFTKVTIPVETIIKAIPKVIKSINTKEKIIIIDDIERKSDNIKLKEILNLVEGIKNNFNKIILIMDTTKLNEEDSEYLNYYFEKIIDRHYEIKEPSVDAKSAILTEIDSQYYDVLEIQDVKNLRTLQKLNSFAIDLNNSQWKEKPIEIKLLYYKLYLFAYRMVKNNEFTAEDFAKEEEQHKNSLLRNINNKNKSEYEILQDRDESIKQQEFIYRHYMDSELLTRQVLGRSLFNKVNELENYFSKFIEAIKSGDIESVFDLNIKFSDCPKEEYENIPIIHKFTDIKNMFNDIESIIKEDKYDPVSVYTNYFKCCAFSWENYYRDNKEWFEESFIEASNEVSTYLLENKYKYLTVGDLILVKNNDTNVIGILIKKIMDKQLEYNILNKIEKELKKTKPDFLKIYKLFEPYKLYRIFNRCVDEKRFIEVGEKLVHKIFKDHKDAFYSTFYNNYAYCFYDYINIDNNDVKNKLINYAKKCGYEEYNKYSSL